MIDLSGKSGTYFVGVDGEQVNEANRQAAEKYAAVPKEKVLATLRGQLFRHLQKLSVPFHDRNIVGVSVSRVINDVAVINELLSQGLVTLIGDVLG